MAQHRTVLAHLHIAAFLLGGTALFSKIIPYGALDIIAYRASFCAIAIACYCIIIRRSLKIKKDLLPLTIATSVLFAIHWLSYFQAMQLSTIAIGMISMFTFPVMTVFLEPLFLKTPLHRRDIAMGLLVVLGVFFMVPEFSLQNDITLGVICGLLSAVAVAFRNILVAKHLNSVSPYTIMFNHALIATLILLPFSQINPGQVSLENLAYLILLGVIFTAIPHTQKTYALSRLKAKSVSMVISLQVVYGSLFAFLILGENLNISTFIGGLFILFAGFYESFSTLREKNHIKSN